ncbi:hypothetical protein ACNKHK_16395 [Shigella flexneri]
MPLPAREKPEPRPQPGDPLLERPLMSAGAAWIIRRIMADQAYPLPDNACRASSLWRGKRAPAMAIAMPGRLALMRVMWIGIGPAGPTVRQWWAVWFASAVPLLNQVNNLLLSRQIPPEDRRPESVSRGVVAGRAGNLSPRDSNCRRRLATWSTGWQSAANVIIARRKGLMAFVPCLAG